MHQEFLLHRILEAVEVIERKYYGPEASLTRGPHSLHCEYFHAGNNGCILLWSVTHPANIIVVCPLVTHPVTMSPRLLPFHDLIQSVAQFERACLQRYFVINIFPRVRSTPSA